MEGWKYYEGKKVFLILKNERQYSGYVLNVDDSNEFLIWLSIIDKFDKRITFCASEIELIQEEEGE
jgi:hypothetical protein